MKYYACQAFFFVNNCFVSPSLPTAKMNTGSIIVAEGLDFFFRILRGKWPCKTQPWWKVKLWRTFWGITWCNGTDRLGGLRVPAGKAGPRTCSVCAWGLVPSEGRAIEFLLFPTLCITFGAISRFLVLKSSGEMRRSFSFGTKSEKKCRRRIITSPPFFSFLFFF